MYNELCIHDTGTRCSKTGQSDSLALKAALDKLEKLVLDDQEVLANKNSAISGFEKLSRRRSMATNIAKLGEYYLAQVI